MPTATVPDDQTDNDAGDDRQGIENPAEERSAQRKGNSRHNARRDIGAHLQGCVRVRVVLPADEEGGNDGCRDADCRNQKGIEGAGAVEPACDQNAERQGRNQRADIAFKQVGTHTGNVADIVADVIGDNGRVPGVVLRDARLNLADQVRADVGRFGIDAAADTGEQSDGGSTQREAEQDIIVASDQVDEAASQQTQAHHAHAHDAAAGEGDRESLVHAGLHRGIGRAHIGLGSDLHPKETRENRKAGPQQEADGRSPSNEEPDQQKENRNKNSKNLVLGHQEGIGALRNSRGDFLHTRGSGRGFGNIVCLISGKAQRTDGQDGDQPE